jgi:chemotaxis protein MotB
MKQVFSIVAFAIFSSILVSCGTGKKLTAASAEITRLNTVVTDQAGKLSANEKEITQLKTENIVYGKEAEDCRTAKAAIAQRYDNLNRNLAEKGTSMKKIQEKALAAISKFEDEGAEVTYKNGMVHINFEDKFFFKSGSSTIGVKGRESLNIVAEVLRENTGVTAIIVGNTDTISVKGIADNWSLSTERANAVVRVLQNTYNIDPARLTAAGKSKFNPVAPNDTPEGRERNRRIEIIFNPDLSRLWDLIEE